MPSAHFGLTQLLLGILALLTVVVMVVSYIKFARMAERAKKEFIEAKEPDIIERIGALEDPNSDLARRVRTYDQKTAFINGMIRCVANMTEVAKNVSNLRK